MNRELSSAEFDPLGRGTDEVIEQAVSRDNVSNRSARAPRKAPSRFLVTTHSGCVETTSTWSHIPISRTARQPKSTLALPPDARQEFGENRGNRACYKTFQ